MVRNRTLFLLSAITVITVALLLGLPKLETQHYPRADTQSRSPVAKSEQNDDLPIERIDEIQAAWAALSLDAGIDLRGQGESVERPLRDPAIPALPSVSGFELGSYGRESAKALAEEIRDHSWADDMEARIRRRYRTMTGFRSPE